MPTKPSSLDPRLLVLLVLLAGATLTGAVLSTIMSQQEEIVFNDYSNRVNSATKQLSNALQEYTTLVLAIQALFHASNNVSRQEFQTFANSLNTDELFPFTQGLSWNVALASKDTVAFERMVRLDDSIQPGGYPDFAIRPKSDENIRYVVTYLHPMEDNEKAFGFDIGSNANRRTTVELARDTGKLVATAPITLVQDSTDQKGFLMMLPVYNTDSNGHIIRKKSEFKGVVTAVFRSADLIASSSDLTFTSLQVFDVTDAVRTEESEYIFNHGYDMPSSDQTSMVRTVDVADRQWELVFTPSKKVSTSKTSNWAVGIFGGLATILSAVFVGFLLNSRQRVNRLAALLTDDLQKTNKELNRSNEDLSQFAYVASHDLQTPIRNVRMSVDFLTEELEESSNPNIREYLNILQNSADRMKTLTSDLLSYAKLGNDEIKKTDINLNTLFKNVEKQTFDLCKENNVSLVIGKMPFINAAEQQIERVFINLVENAIRYSHNERSPVIDISSSDTGNELNIFVKDNSIGIDNKYHETIFTPFRRLHRQDEIQGSGLGLAICRKIVDRHEGAISVESSSDNGTTFLVTLPK